MNCGCEYGENCSKVSVCFMEQRVADELHEANERIAHLEALLGEAPHSVSCQTLWPVPNGRDKWPCNCFKTRI
jgi:hypothetical protein